MNLKERMETDVLTVEKKLEEYLATKNDFFPGLFEAMRYTTLAGGKRIRAFLTLEFCRICGGNEEDAVPFACAVEMIHAYSLIHDDLPCMDDDDMRRGKKSNHIVFGEAQALLAGDALLTYAFEVCAKNPRVPSEQNAKAVGILAEFAGPCGMVGGQSLDLIGESRKLSKQELTEVHKLKTGALIRSACLLGCCAAKDGYKFEKQADEYGLDIGLVFQIIDDILDVTGDENTLGKPIGSDKDKNKTTYLSYMSLEETKNYAKELNERAKKVLGESKECDILKELADYLLNRKK